MPLFYTKKTQTISICYVLPRPPRVTLPDLGTGIWITRQETCRVCDNQVTPPLYKVVLLEALLFGGRHAHRLPAPQFLERHLRHQHTYSVEPLQPARLRQLERTFERAALVAVGRAATAQDDITGDGTTTNVLFTGEIMRQAERFLGEGVHPRVLVDGMELAKTECLKFLETFKVEKEVTRELLVEVPLDREPNFIMLNSF